MPDSLIGGMLPGRDRFLSPPGDRKPWPSLAHTVSAMVFMVGFLGLLWVIQIVNWADSYRLDTRFGIVPGSTSHLADIFTAPFLHYTWGHIEGNSIPLLVLGFLAAYRGIGKFLGVTAIVMVTSGLAVWLFQAHSEPTVGASGLIFGYFGYVLVRGLFDRNFLDAIVGVAAAIAYAYILTVAIPGTPGVSWLGHVGGLAGGVLAGWVLRARRPARPVSAVNAEGPAASRKASPEVGNSRGALHKELDDMGL